MTGDWVLGFEGKASVDCGTGVGLTESHTIEFRIKFTKRVNTWAQIIAKEAPTTKRSPGVWQRENKTALHWRYDPQNQGTLGAGPGGANSEFTLNTWYHVAGVRHGDELIIYVNGEPAETVVVKNVDNGTGRFTIGAATIYGSFTGQLSEVRVWGRARTAAEIGADKEGRLRGDEDGLIAYWPLDDGPDSTTIADRSVGGNTGTIQGAEWVRSDVELAAPAMASDAALAESTAAKLRELKLAKSAPAAPEAGTTTTIGVVVVDFDDHHVDESANPGAHWDQLRPEKATQWFEEESQGRFFHDFDLHPSVLRLPGGANTYKGHTNKIADAVDELLDVPDEWNVVLICMPNLTPLRDLVRSSRSTCTFDEDGTNQGEVRPTVFLDQGVYGEGGDRAWATVVHELLHALGLHDLYVNKPGRSFGWSMMSDCRTARHLLAWEKLTLGWADIDDYFFVQDGIGEATIVQARADGKKGVFVLDPTRGGGALVLEWSQPTGKTEAAVNAESDSRSSGLLAYRVGWSDSPLVTLYPWKSAAQSNEYGGAPLAPCPIDAAPAELGRTGLRAEFVRGDGDGASATVRAGRIPNFVAPSHAAVVDGTPLMRVDDYLVSADRQWSLRLDSDAVLRVYRGDLSAEGPAGEALSFCGPEPDKVREKYGFFVQVNNDGALEIHYGTGSDDDQEGLYTSSAPSSQPADGEGLFLAIESDGAKPAVRTYAGHSLDDPSSRLLGSVSMIETDLGTSTSTLRYDQHISSPDGAWKVTLQSDGYLTLRHEGAFAWHHTENSRELGDEVSIDESGAVRVMSNSNEVWKYPGTVPPGGTGDAAIRVTDNGKIEVFRGESALYTLRP